MNRRGFLARLGAAAVALTLARHLPGIAPSGPALQKRPEPVAVSDGQFKAGDVVTFSGHYAFDPVTRQPATYLQNFIVTAVTSAGITVEPGAVARGQRMTLGLTPRV